MKKILTLFGLAATLALSASVAMADLKTCVTAATRGPEKRFQKVHGHEFHCKPVQSVALQGGATKVIGQLSHNAGFRPDDEVDFEFVIRNGTIVKDTLKIHIIPDCCFCVPVILGTAIGAYYGVPISPEEAEAVSRKLAGQVTGRGWKAATDLIVTTVALKMASEARVAQR